MNTVACKIAPERISPRALARIWGGIGLFGIAAGFFDIGYIHGHIVMSGDAAETARNLKEEPGEADPAVPRKHEARNHAESHGRDDHR